MVNNLSSDSYGNIQRIGLSQNGRAIYRVIDSNGQEAGKLSISQADTDKFEKAYIDIMKTAPKIQDYVVNNSSEQDIKRRRTLSRVIVATGGLIGAIVPIVATKKASTLKKILYTTVGIVAGISAGFAGSIAATTPPGTFKFAKATKTLSKIDVRPVVNDNV